MLTHRHIRAAASAACILAAGAPASAETLAHQGFDDNSVLSTLLEAPKGDAYAFTGTGAYQDGSGLGWTLSGGLSTKNNGDPKLLGVLEAGVGGLSNGRAIRGDAARSGGVLYVEKTDAPLILSFDAVDVSGRDGLQILFSLAATSDRFDPEDGLSVLANGVEIASWYGDALQTLSVTADDFTDILLLLTPFEDTSLSVAFVFESDAANEDFALDSFTLIGSGASALQEVPAPPAFALLAAGLAALGLWRRAHPARAGNGGGRDER